MGSLKRFTAIEWEQYRTAHKARVVWFRDASGKRQTGEVIQSGIPVAKVQAHVSADLSKPATFEVQFYD